ncbi:MAG: Gfo/Idh/MocA family oxidoreductase [Lentisphaerae bacterium]|nr:Gfo/Idh/MocA family oxidoreductase [Lentisphaerota bacterium]
MTAKKYRIGMLGCGGVSGFHLEGWDAWKDVSEISALCDIKASQMESTRKRFPELCAKAQDFTDYREMLAKGLVDIVCICSFGDQHLEHTQACLEAGTHVMMEKPVGYSMAEARRFKHMAIKYSDRRVAIAFSLRYRKAYMEMRALIRSGILGEIVTGEISYSHPHFGKREEIKEGREGAEYLQKESDLAGGDTTVQRGLKSVYEDGGGNYVASSELTHATHPWDMARYLLGEVREVFSTESSVVLDHPDGGQGVQMGMLWMKSGALCHVLAGATRVPSIGGNQHQFVQVHGVQGSAWLTRDLYEPYGYHALYRTDGEIQTAPSVTDLPDSSHGVVIRSKNLMDAIEGKAELICSMDDGARTTELLAALHLSERTQTKTQVLPGRVTG